MQNVGDEKARNQEPHDAWGLLIKGDMSAFESFCAHVEAPLYGYVRKMLGGDASEAEEVAQEALFRLYEALVAGRVEREPRAYVFSIAHNLAQDVLRRLARSKAMVEDSAVVPWPGAPRPHATNRPVERSMLREEIDKALASLPDAHRSALMLREFGELRYEEIAGIEGISVEQVKVRIFRARRRLAELLDRDGQYLGQKQNGA